VKGNYLLMTGAPGSRWSGVANNIWKSFDIDQSDYSPERTYSHNKTRLHSGAYFDPMMEFEFEVSNWDKPFDHRGLLESFLSASKGVRLIKSHTLATQLENYKKYPIIMVYRNDYECWEWWNECGGFDIPYPKYDWYKNQDNMFAQIQRQNQDIMTFIYKNRDRVTRCSSNLEVLDLLGLDKSVDLDHYASKDVSVYVYL